jgi:N6-adenosine-specific RNA methylase IME4
VIVADPPWAYEHPEQDREVENHYQTMSHEDICAMGPKVPTADSSILYLWAPGPKVAEAVEVMTAWDFDYRTCMIWVKPSMGPGYYVRGRHELVLVGVRGRFPIPGETVRPDSVFEAPRGAHSEKPEVLQELIERAYPDMPRLEMFARRPRNGWTAWSDQAP